MCVPVIVKDSKFRGQKCQVKYVKEFGRVIETTCYSDKPNISKAAMDYFQKMYDKKQKF